MQRNKLKTAFISFLVLLAMCFGAAFAACSSKPAAKSVTLVDFTSETETVGLGETYVLPNGVVFDKEGNDYRVLYTVVDANGNTVSVINSRFTVKLAGNAAYVITCTAKISAQKTQARTITLNVVDRTAPRITFSDLKFAYVNNQYEISGIRITDNSGENITPTYKVFVKETGEEIPVTDGKFTPTVKGEYELQIKATDSLGNTSTETATIIVREEMGKYVIENFDDGYGKDVFSVYKAGFTDKDIQCYPEFDPTPEDADNGDTRVGVVSGTSTMSVSAEYGPHFYFRFDENFKNVEDFEYVYIKAYIKSAIADKRPQVTIYSQNEPLGDNGVVNVNEWVEIRITKENICSPDSAFTDPSTIKKGETPIECFIRKLTSDNGYYLFYISTKNFSYEVNSEQVFDSANNYVLYVDEIGYKPVFNPTAELAESYALGETLTINPTVVTDDDNYEITVKVTAPNGTETVLSGNTYRFVETGKYTIELVYASDDYSGYRKYEVTVIADAEISVDEYDGEYTQGDTVSVLPATFGDTAVSVSVYVNGIQIPDNGTTFVAGVAGDYEVIYTAERDGLVYRAIRTLTVDAAQVGEDEVQSFSDKQTTLDNIELYNLTANWLPYYEGEYGVIKLNASENWGHFGFKPLQSISAYENCGYLVIRMYVATENAEQELRIGNLAGTCQTDIKVGEWVDYYFDGATFLEKWADFENEFRITSMSLQFKRTVEAYISDIYVANASVATGNQVNPFTYELDAKKTEGYNLDIEWLPDYEGEYGVIKLNASENWGHFGFKPLQSISAYENCGYLVIRMYVATENAEQELRIGNLAGTCQTDIKVGEWVDYYFDGATFLEKWADFENEFSITSMSLQFKRPVEAYISDIYVEYSTVATGNQVNPFTYELDAVKTKCDGVDVEWLSEYEGATGVVKLTVQENWKYFGFKPLQSMSAYEDCAYLVMRMYIATEDAEQELWLGNQSGTCITDIKVGEWVDYYFDGATFLTKWADFESEFNLYKMGLTFKRAATVYVDEIYVVKATNATGNQINPFTYELDAKNTKCDGVDVEWLSEYEGATGVVKLTVNDNWGYFGFKPLQSISAYEGCTYVVMRMYIATENDEQGLWFGAEDGKCYTDIKVGEWVDYYFDGATFLTKWADFESDFNLYNMCLQFKRAATIYVDEIYVTNGELPQA